VRLSRITKSFGPVTAVRDVSLEIPSGEIVAVVGENGAGKTTLMRIAAGELRADGGSITGTRFIGFVHQHFLLVPQMTIAENLALSDPRPFRFATRATLAREASATIAATGIPLDDVTRRVEDLSVGEKAKLELIKALARRPQLLILDEPTSVLTPSEAEELFAVMRKLASLGTAVVFISHKLPEVLAVAHRVVVMRAGAIVLDTREPSADLIAQAMVASRTPEAASPRQRKGRITAIVGVAGNGQSELASRLRKEHPEAAHVPEDRTHDGVIAEMSIAENLALRAPRWRPRDAERVAEAAIARYGIRAHSARQRLGELSGGNQQKVLLARELDRGPSMIVAAEPTRGLDLEATAFVHTQLRMAADRGASVLLITSDLDEAYALADEVQVIYRGKLSKPMTPAEAGSRVPALMAGLE
jgi:ABC-type uncharacterized transport system ATPase subunit